MTHLHELSSDQILTTIEKRSDALAVKERIAAELETDLKAWEAATYKALRDAHGVTEAKELVRAQDGWKDRYLDVQTANIEAAQAKRDHQRAMVASDMWRTEMAGRRSV